MDSDKQHQIPTTAQTEKIYEQFDSSRAFELVETQLAFGYRIPGTEPSHLCAQWINSQMQNYGESEIIDYEIRGVNCKNVLSKLHNNDPDEENIVIFAAHYDSRAVAEKDPDTSKRLDPIDGANDGASGVAVLIEIARVLALNNLNYNSQFWFLFFDAEDQGKSNNVYGIDGWDWIEGSKWQANDMKNNPQNYFSDGQNLSNVAAFILFDMVGGINLQFQLVSPYNSILYQQIYSSGRSLGYTHQFPLGQTSYTIIDDHVPFANFGVPTFDLIIKFWDNNNGWPYHHTHADNIDNIDKESLKITGKTVLKYVLDYQIGTPLQIPSNDFPDENTTNSEKWWENVAFIYSIGVFSVVCGVIIYLRYSSNKRFKKEIQLLERE